MTPCVYRMRVSCNGGVYGIVVRAEGFGNAAEEAMQRLKLTEAEVKSIRIMVVANDSKRK